MSDDFTNVMNPLIIRYGEAVVMRWINVLGHLQLLSLNGLGALSTAEGEPLIPDAAAIVLRFPSDHPDGSCAVLGLAEPQGMMSTGEKEAILARALESLGEADLLPLSEEMEAARKMPKANGKTEPAEEAPADEDGRITLDPGDPPPK